MIETLENLLVAALSAAHAGTKVIVEPYPRPGESYILKGEAAILVHYGGADFDAPFESSDVSQVLTCNFQVLTISRNLRSHTGAYALMDKNRNAAVGLVSGQHQFHAVSEGFLSIENGVWWYSQIFAVPQWFQGEVIM